jgi:hypothetical protein
VAVLMLDTYDFHERPYGAIYKSFPPNIQCRIGPEIDGSERIADLGSNEQL